MSKRGEAAVGRESLAKLDMHAAGGVTCDACFADINRQGAVQLNLGIN